MGDLPPIVARGSQATSPHVEPILHPVFSPLVLLGRRNLQSFPFLLPLRHEGIAAVLSYELVFADPLRLTLKLIILAKRTNVQLRTIRKTSPAKFAKGKNTVRSKVVELHLKSFEDFTKKPRHGEAKAASKEILENHSFSSLRLRNRLPLRRPCLPLANKALLFQRLDHILHHK